MNILTILKKKTRSLVKKAHNKIDYVKMALLAAFTAITCAPGMAKATDVDDLFTAVDVTGLQANIKTFMLGFAAIMVLFLGWKYLKRTSNRV